MNSIMYDKLLSPINYGGIELKNRIIFAPTTMGLKDKDYLSFIEKIAKGGTAMIIVGDVPAGKSMFVKSIANKKGFSFFKKCVDIAHQYDCKIIAQLHADDSDIKGMMKMMPKMIFKRMKPDEIHQALNGLTSNYISNLSLDKIKRVIDDFQKTAIRCKKAGFDGLQVHGDRMLGSFTSAIINKRTDSYGGKLKNRLRLPLECVEAIKKVLPDMPIDFKLAVRIENPHYGNGGILFEEMKYFIPKLEEAGVNSFHIALADHSSLSDTIPFKNHPYFKDEGCFLSFAKEARKYTSLPISLAGCISHPEFIEELLTNEGVDCASMSRELICDSEYVNKIRTNHASEIKYCIRCNKGCLGGIMEHKGVHCIFDEKLN